MAVVQNALWRRDEQVRRWKLSETNTEPSSPKEKRKPTVKFQDSYVFLAACSSCDKEEIERLLKRGADINTANIDGLTALHQACIDDNLSMVQFLINQGADIDACDNEGWTALHATASCGFLEIAKYLVEKGADIAAVNNDGELASDLAEGDSMECFLAEEMEIQGIDADAARNEEENIMLRDANQWLSGNYDDVPHQKTGATALHVAAAKGYLKVITILLQAGADINSLDFDGWTPLHAAAHWGQDEVCKLLVDNNCDMNIRNNSGQTALDLADTDVVPLLEELKKSQASLKESNFLSNSLNDISSEHKSQSTKRRSSVTRMSGDQKQHIVSKSVEDERSKLQELRKVEEEKEDVKKEVEQPLKEDISDVENDDEMYDDDEAGSSESDSDKQVENKRKPQDKDQKTGSGLINRPLSNSTAMLGPTDNQIGSLAGLRKTGSSSAVPDLKVDVDKLARSASSSWIEKKENTDDDKSRPRRIMSYTGVGDNSTDSGKVKVNDFYARYTSLLKKTTSTTPTTQTSTVTTPSSGLGDSKSDLKPDREQKYRTDITSPTRTSFPSVGSTSSTTTTIGPGSRRTYEPPKRDEEKEVERKARAKRARETRRSTQGVTKEDIVKAEEALKLANQGDELRASTDKSKYKKEYNHDSSTDDKSDKENKPENFSTQTPSQQFSYKIDKIDNKNEIDDSNNQVNDRRSRDIKDTTLLLSTDSSFLKKEDPSQKSTAIKARRKRESRRPTGKITLEDIQGVPSETKEGNDGKKEEKEEPLPKQESLLRPDPLLKQSTKQTTSRYSEPVTSTLQNLTDNGRHSYPVRTRTSALGSSDKGTIDFIRLYEQEKAENEKLRKEIDTLKQELTETQLTLERTKQKTEAKSNDSREKRALERKVAKLEEEVKSIESLKSDNMRLKEENGALIRVISKLSK